MVAKSNNRNTDESNKFVNDSSGDVAVNTVIGGGELRLVGMNTAILITNASVSDTATALPSSPLTNRNSLIVYNKDPVEKIYLGPSNVAASGSLEGWIVDPESYFSVDITDDVVLYAIADAGKTVAVKIMEMA